MAYSPLLRLYRARGVYNKATLAALYTGSSGWESRGHPTREVLRCDESEGGSAKGVPVGSEWKTGESE